jgi:hypothetical protein
MATSPASTVEASPSTEVADSVTGMVMDNDNPPQWIKPFDFENFKFRGDATTVMQRVINNEKLPDDAVESICRDEWDVQPDDAEIIEKDIIEAVDMGGLWLQQMRFHGLECLYIDSPDNHPREMWATRFGMWNHDDLESLKREEIRSYFGGICTAIQSVYIRVQQKADPPIIQDIVGQYGPQNFPTQYQQDQFSDSLYPGWGEYDPDAEGRINPVPDCTTTAW